MHLNLIINEGPDGIDNTALATIALLTVSVAVFVLFRRRIQKLLERANKASGALFNRSVAKETSDDEIVSGNLPESQVDEQSDTKHVPRGH